jgi:hypothetical protein
MVGDGRVEMLLGGYADRGNRDIIRKSPSHVVTSGEFFNAFNQVNLGQPAQVVSSASFGRITSAEDGRVGQLVAKILW